jgi:hypothetical protein
VVRGTRPHGAGRLQKASDSPRKINSAGIEAYPGILRSKNEASAFSKRGPKHSDARVSFSLHPGGEHVKSSREVSPAFFSYCQRRICF